MYKFNGQADFLSSSRGLIGHTAGRLGRSVRGVFSSNRLVLWMLGID